MVDVPAVGKEVMLPVAGLDMDPPRLAEARLN